jgi:hypothetical protein
MIVVVAPDERDFRSQADSRQDIDTNKIPRQNLPSRPRRRRKAARRPRTLLLVRDVPGPPPNVPRVRRLRASRKRRN